MKRLKSLLASLVVLAAARTAQAAPEATRQVALPLAELGSSADALRLSTRASESLAFNARADQLLTSASLSLPLASLPAIEGLQSLEVDLNGERVGSLEAAQLRTGGEVALAIDPGLLASSNQLAFRYTTLSDPTGCGHVPEGSWSPLAQGSLTLGSASLPLPTDLEVLPLPFYDPNFDRAQTIHFVFPRRVSAEQLYAADLVASWFALRGSGRLTFDTQLGQLPAGPAVVFIDDLESARLLGITPRADQPPSALELRAHPRRPDEKLLVVWGLGEGSLVRAARRLLKDGTELAGPMVAAPFEVELPSLSPRQVPRWVGGNDIVLGKLPENPALRAQGGTATTLRMPFRMSPDAFAWPRDWVELDVGYSQSHTAASGPAHLHVALNGVSIAVLPQARKSRSKLRVPRSLLRGFNELLVQISYPDRVQKRAQSCEELSDDAAWVQIEPDSTLRMGTTERFAMLPDLNVFLYDGFPFTEHGDLRETMVILPSAPDSGEIAIMLDAVAHLASITGYPPVGLQVTLGTPAASALNARDALLIAGLGRHPLLSSWAAALPLVGDQRAARAQHPESATLLRRLLTGRIGNNELVRAQGVLDEGPFGAVMGVTAPWDTSRSLVVMTASDAEHMPPLTALLDYADAVRQRNDLLVLGDQRRALFQLGSEVGRGQLPPLLSLRWWLAHYWVALLPLLLLASLAFGLYGRIVLARVAHQRLHEIEA